MVDGRLTNRVDDARTVAQGDFGPRPAFDRCREGGAGEEEVVHAGQVLVEVRAGDVVPAVDRMGMGGMGPDS